MAADDMQKDKACENYFAPVQSSLTAGLLCVIAPKPIKRYIIVLQSSSLDKHLRYRFHAGQM